MGQNLHKILNPALAAQEEISLEAKGGTKSLFFSGPEVLISDQHWKIPLYTLLGCVWLRKNPTTAVFKGKSIIR